MCDCITEQTAVAVKQVCLWDIGSGESGKSSCVEPEETVGVMKWSCASCVLHQECWPGRQYVLPQEMKCWGPPPRNIPSSALVFLRRQPSTSVRLPLRSSFLAVYSSSRSSAAAALWAGDEKVGHHLVECHSIVLLESSQMAVAIRRFLLFRCFTLQSKRDAARTAVLPISVLFSYHNIDYSDTSSEVGDRGCFSASVSAWQQSQQSLNSRLHSGEL